MNQEDKYDPIKKLQFDLENCKETLEMYKISVESLERAIDEGQDERFEPIAAKPTVHELGMFPTRIVLLKWTGRKEGEWSTHWQVFPSNRKSYYVHGHYFVSKNAAFEDFHDRGI